MPGADPRRLDPVRLTLVVVTSATALLLAAFFAFVGYMKTFAPLATLAQHHAWTVALPEWLGRAVGVSELLCAAALLAALALRGKLVWAERVAGVLIVNQLAAAAVHWTQGETDALPQNGVLIALLLVCGGAARGWRHRARPR